MSFFIGELSKKTGVSVSTIRYYERLLLLNAPERTESGYRLYSEYYVTEVRFISKAKALGFSLEEIREILDMARKGTAPCEYVKETIKGHLDELERRISELVLFKQHLAGYYEQIINADSSYCSGSICMLVEKSKINHATGALEE